MRTVLRTLLGASLVTISLAIPLGCQSTTPIVSTSGGDFCDIAEPLRWASTDHALTKEGIWKQNAAGCEICSAHPKWKPKCVGQYKPMAPVP